MSAAEKQRLSDILRSSLLHVCAAVDDVDHMATTAARPGVFLREGSVHALVVVDESDASSLTQPLSVLRGSAQLRAYAERLFESLAPSGMRYGEFRVHCSSGATTVRVDVDGNVSVLEERGGAADSLKLHISLSKCARLRGRECVLEVRCLGEQWVKCCAHGDTSYSLVAWNSSGACVRASAGRLTRSSACCACGVLALKLKRGVRYAPSRLRRCAQ